MSARFAPRPILSITLVVAFAAFTSASSKALPSHLPPRLSQTGLYADIVEKQIDRQNRSFVPQYPLWSDGAKKSRWIFLPPNSVINTTDRNRWVFPVGTTFWKEFRQSEKRIETRILRKVRPDADIEAWVMASYVWDDAESDAVLVGPEGLADAAPTPFGNVTHDIPTSQDCAYCHNRGGDPVLGFNALQLSDERDPLAPNRELTNVGDLLLSELERRNFVSMRFSTSPVIPARTPIERAALGYLFGNCASCHNPQGEAGFTGWFMDIDTTLASVGHLQAITKGVDVLTQHFELPGREFGVDSYRIESGTPEGSAVFVRARSRDMEIQMPPMATKVSDSQALDLLYRWISDLKSHEGK